MEEQDLKEFSILLAVYDPGERVDTRLLLGLHRIEI